MWSQYNKINEQLSGINCTKANGEYNIFYNLRSCVYRDAMFCVQCQCQYTYVFAKAALW